jgi:hypothetical protein
MRKVEKDKQTEVIEKKKRRKEKQMPEATPLDKDMESGGHGDQVAALK